MGERNIKNLIQDYLETDEEKILWEMSNIGSSTTGLPSNIVIWPRTEGNKLQHSEYWIKAEKVGKWNVVYSVDKDNPKIETPKKVQPNAREDRAIKDFIRKTHDILKDHIDGKITSDELIDKIRERLK